MVRDRREFLQLLAAAGLVSGCAESAPVTGVDDMASSAIVKDPSPFVRHGTGNLESRLEDLRGFLTPMEQFFVRNNDVTQRIDATDYRLEVTGSGVARPMVLTMEQLLALPSRTVFSYLECGGNQRSFFGSLLGRPARGTQWGRGAVGMAAWTGVPLVEVLRRAGVKDSAEAVQLVGLDRNAPEGGFRRPLPIEKALDPDTLLAYDMNAAPLPPDHGFPIRALVPGWVGSSSVKWLGSIIVSTEPVWSRNNTTSYVLIGDAYPPEDPALGQVATEQSTKSALALPWPAVIQAGPQRLRGYAHAAKGPVMRVEYSTDGGSVWHEATLLEPRLRYGWCRFEFMWDARPGTHVILTSATDAAGVEQPTEIPFNEKGYLFNMRLPHPVTVTA